MHMPVALGEVGSGVADAAAAVGESIGHLIDRRAEAPCEEAAAGVMQPRLGLAAALIDGERVGLDHGGAEQLSGFGKLGERTLGLLRHDGVTVAAGNALGHTCERTQRPLDGKGGEQSGDAAQHQAEKRPARLGGQNGDEAGAKHRQHDQANGNNAPRRSRIGIPHDLARDFSGQSLRLSC